MRAKRSRAAARLRRNRRPHRRICDPRRDSGCPKQPRPVAFQSPLTRFSCITVGTSKPSWLARSLPPLSVMATLHSFEELDVWQKARVLTREVYLASRTGDFARDLALRDHARRSAVSVMSNIAEGFERGNAGDLVRFLAIAKGSVGELRAQLIVAADLGYLDAAASGRLSTLCLETASMIGGLRRYVKGQRAKSGRRPTTRNP